jgi:hypothetical protein
LKFELHLFHFVTVSATQSHRFVVVNCHCFLRNFAFVPGFLWLKSGVGVFFIILFDESLAAFFLVSNGYALLALRLIALLLGAD